MIPRIVRALNPLNLLWNYCHLAGISESPKREQINGLDSTARL
jgi:hypothetical protein